MTYKANNYKYLLGLDSLSDELLSDHFTLYEGYVKNTNSLIAEINELLAIDTTEIPQFNELKRRFGWEFNGMRLHEYYFENMTKDPIPLDEDSPLFAQIEHDFGSFENWQKDFRATGLIRGNGWVILYFDQEAGVLHNVWIGEHNINHLASAVPLLAMDVWEHAYIKKFGLKRKDYINAFFEAIDWTVVEERF